MLLTPALVLPPWLLPSACSCYGLLPAAHLLQCCRAFVEALGPTPCLLCRSDCPPSWHLLPKAGTLFLQPPNSRIAKPGLCSFPTLLQLLCFCPQPLCTSVPLPPVYSSFCPAPALCRAVPLLETHHPPEDVPMQRIPSAGPTTLALCNIAARLLVKIPPRPIFSHSFSNVAAC